MAKIQSYPEFERRLQAAIPLVAALAKQAPEREILSIHQQLLALETWTRGGQKPTQPQKDDLNFGLLASRAVDEMDPRLAQELYALASFVTDW
jgi:hypothetical protein